MGGETNTSKAGDAKVGKWSQSSRADGWKGKGVVGSPSNNPQKKRSIDVPSSALSTRHHQLPHSKTKSAPSPSKSVVKSKTTTSTSSSKIITTKRATVRARSEKKAYTLPGQKHDPPEEREPLRIFYESLLKQIPASEMAEVCAQIQWSSTIQENGIPHALWDGLTLPPLPSLPSPAHPHHPQWMMEHGLLSPERAKKAYERKQKRQQQQKVGTPTKSTKMEILPTPQKQQSSKNVNLKTKKRIKYSDSDDDFLVKLKKARG
ncbi:hypothetical protein ACLOJK_040171 [Asimina triloba]